MLPDPRLGVLHPLAAAALAALCVGCAGAPPRVPAWSAPAIAVDGAYADWEGRFTRIAGKRNLGLGVANDRQSLYLALVTRDLQVQSLLQSAGFTLWLDPQGSSRERIGMRLAPQETQGDAPMTPRIEIVFDGAEYGYQLAAPGPEAAVDAKSARQTDVLVYEFRVALGHPLVESERDAASATLELGPVLGIGLVSEALTPRERQPGAPRVRTPKPLELWAVAEIASRQPPGP